MQRRTVWVLTRFAAGEQLEGGLRRSGLGTISHPYNSLNATCASLQAVVDVPSAIMITYHLPAIACTFNCLLSKPYSLHNARVSQKIKDKQPLRSLQGQ